MFYARVCGWLACITLCVLADNVNHQKQYGGQARTAVNSGKHTDSQSYHHAPVYGKGPSKLNVLRYPKTEDNLSDNYSGEIPMMSLDETLQMSLRPEMTNTPWHVNGIFPNLAATAESAPKRSECGIGALMPWADKLYMVTYLSVPGAGGGTGLYAIDGQFHMEKLVNHSSTFANRLLHKESSQIIIGAWVIDSSGTVRTFSQLTDKRITSTAEHLTNNTNLVYMLEMEGILWECDVYTLNCSLVADLVKELDIPTDIGEQVHFKAAHTMDGRLVVASNTFEQADFLRKQHGGRLAEWTGGKTKWTILERTAFVEVTGRSNFGKVIYALGWDERSVILKVYDGGDKGEPSQYAKWQTYRLPKASHAYDHLWQTEWPRIREVETERYLVDIHGMFYELSPLGWAGSTWGLRPISQHLRMIPDFTSFRGMLVLGGNQVSSIFDANIVTGQAQSGLWFGKTDDLWRFGKPQGWGALWRRDNVTSQVPSDPFLMTGFDKKVLHLTVDQCYSIYKTTMTYPTFSLEIDITGAAGHISGEPWVRLSMLRVNIRHGKPIAPGYVYYIFPEGFSAHWVRLVPQQRCVGVTAYFHYT